MMTLGAFMILLCLSVSTLNAQTIYKWKDEKGTWHFSQTPPTVKEPGLTEIKLPQAPLSTERAKGGTARPQVYLSIKDAELKMEDGGLLVVGTIINRGLDFEKGVEVRVQLGGDDGWVLSESKSETSPRHLQPRGAGAFVFKINTDKAVSVAILTRDDQKKLDISEDLRRQIAKARPAPVAAKPRVSVISTNLYRAVDSNIYFSGKVYNAGSAIARNVKVFFTIKNQSGHAVERNSAFVDPADLKPGGEGIFQRTVTLNDSPSQYSWFTEVEHSE